MSTPLNTDLVQLHPKACQCSTCCPWIPAQTTGGNMPSQSFWISRQSWVQAGKPGCIEELFGKRQEQIQELQGWTVSVDGEKGMEV